jgi:aquaporin NIP
VRRAGAELVGTFFLVMIGPGAAAANAWTGGAVGVTGVALAFMLVIAAMIHLVGPASGAHINPAVTIALAVRRRFPARDAVIYVAAQCAGAVLAGLVLRAAFGDAARSAATTPQVGIGAAFGFELLMSALLMLVILAAIDRSSQLAPLLVGGTVGGCALAGGPITGASMNPARSLGPALASGVWVSHWLYWLAPIAGMVLAALCYDMARKET